MEDPPGSPIQTTVLSDSDDDLDVPEFSKIFGKRPIGTSSQERQNANQDPSPSKINRLDSLLSDHEKEATERARLEKVKEQLMQDIATDSQEEEQSHSQSLASEHEDHLQQLEVRSSEPLSHPGTHLFHPEKYCCLFAAQTSPLAYGFTSSGSYIDKMLANVVPETLTTLLLSKALVTCVKQIGDLNSVMNWLLNLMSIHPSSIICHSCYINLTGILHQFNINLLARKSRWYQSWSPHPLALLRVFVNMGADPEDLLGRYHSYSQDEIRKFLTVDEKAYEQSEKCFFRKENVQLVLKALAVALQTQLHAGKEDLNQMFYMIAKVLLDSKVNRFISLEVQQCFGALLQCYKDEDWPEVVPDLCRRLQDISNHHHNQAYLTDLIPGTDRGSFLQVRLSYECLRALLLLEDTSQVDSTSSEIVNFKLDHVPNLSWCDERPPFSPLAKALRALLEKDLYKTISAIKLLDMCVGDDLYRSKQPWQSLEYLIEQINLVLRTIKDNISAMDLSKIKDSLSKLKVKWSLSLQDHRSKQRTLFPWLSQTGRTGVTQEVLRGGNSLVDDDLE